MTGNEPPTVLTPFMEWPDGLVLVLASRSPRRSSLLATAGIPFTCDPAGDVEVALAAELINSGVAPADYAERLALAKATDVAQRRPADLVLGADTVVVLDGEILEKPANPVAAMGLLQRLSGRRHTVVSALALVGRGAGCPGLIEHESTEVEFRELTTREIEKYVDTGEPMDKAGAYGIQGYGALMVSGIRGCYFNVMGLPLARLATMLSRVFGS